MSRQFGLVFLSLFLIFGAIFCSATVEGRVLYVSYDGSNTPPHTSWATAAYRISFAADYCLPGDTIRVGPGVFFDPQTIQLNQGVTLIGAGPDSSILRNYGSPQVQIEVDSSVNLKVSGIRFISKPSRDLATEGILYGGWPCSLVVQNCAFDSIELAIVSIAGYLEVSHCHFYDCAQNTFHSVVNPTWGSGNVEVINCTFENKRELYGSQASVYIDWPFRGGSFRLAGNVFKGYQESIKLFSLSGQVIIENNICINNAFHDLPGVYMPAEYLSLVSPSVIVRNNYFEGDHPDSAYYGKFPLVEFWGFQEADFYNNIATGVQRVYGIEFSDPLDSSKYFSFRNSHNLFWLNQGLPTGIVIHDGEKDSLGFESLIRQTDTSMLWIGDNLNRDPMFVDTIDYLLAAGSPCIDAGRPGVLDLDGSRSDIGPFGGSAGKLYAYQDFAPATPESFSGTAKSTGATLQWLRNTESDLKYLALFKSTSGSVPIDSAHVIAYFHQFNDSLLRKTPDDCTFLSYTDTSYSAVTGGRYTIVAVDSIGLVSQPAAEVVFIGTDVDDQQDPPLPQTASLEQNYPNPFNATTAIVYSLPNIGAQPATVRLEIFNLLGQLVRVLVDESQFPGQHIAYWDGRDRTGREVASGTYLYKLTVGGIEFVKSKKLVLLK